MKPADLPQQYLDKSDVDFWSPARWSVLGTLLNNGVAKAVYVIPVAGYIILYSDFFDPLFHFSRLGHAGGFFTVMERLNMAYYGACAMLVAYVIYFFCAPRLRLFRASSHGTAFVTQIIVAHDFSTLFYICRQVSLFLEKSGLPSPEQHPADRMGKLRTSMRRWQQGSPFGSGEMEFVVPDILRMYYNWQNFTWPPVRALILGIALVGYFLLLLPAIDLFVRVVKTSLDW